MTVTKALIADWVLPATEAPIANGAILVDDRNQILYVGPQSQMPPCDVVQPYKKTAILPGLINAHTHLEFSDLTEPLGRPGINFTKWISEVIAWRNQVTDKRSAIARGIELSVAAGVAAIGEIASPPMDPTHYAKPTGVSENGDLDDCLVQVFQETLGAEPNEYDQKIDQVIENATALAGLGVTPGISPHAPYSVPQILLERLVGLTETGATQRSAAASFMHAARTEAQHGQLNDRGGPVSGDIQIVAMHVAETVAEREFVEHRRGRFLEMLKQFGVWRPEMYPANGSILNILAELSKAPRALVIHGNYLTSAEINFIATCNDRMSIVFCPRTHRYFQHVNYPINAILDRGINLAVGTDSLASNPDLSVLNELKEIRRNFPQIPDSTILEMGTINGAIALGIGDRLGSLTTGKAAKICKVALPDVDDPFSWLS